MSVYTARCLAWVDRTIEQPPSRRPPRLYSPPFEVLPPVSTGATRGATRGSRRLWACFPPGPRAGGGTPSMNGARLRLPRRGPAGSDRPIAAAEQGGGQDRAVQALDRPARLARRDRRTPGQTGVRAAIPPDAMSRASLRGARRTTRVVSLRFDVLTRGGGTINRRIVSAGPAGVTTDGIRPATRPAYLVPRGATATGRLLGRRSARPMFGWLLRALVLAAPRSMRGSRATAASAGARTERGC